MSRQLPRHHTFLVTHTLAFSLPAPRSSPRQPPHGARVHFCACPVSDGFTSPPQAVGDFPSFMFSISRPICSSWSRPSSRSAFGHNSPSSSSTWCSILLFKSLNRAFQSLLGELILTSTSSSSLCSL